MHFQGFSKLRSLPLVATAILVLDFALRTTILHDLGISWDECTYIQAAQSYLGWLKDPVYSPQGIYDAWISNYEHPPLAKLWYSGFQAIFGDWLGLVTASRLGASALFLGMGCLAYQTASLLSGQWAGLFAVLCLVFSFRISGEAALANIDLMLAASSLFTLWALVRVIKRRTHSAWAISLGLGFCLLSKISGWFLLPVFFILSYLWISAGFFDRVATFLLAPIVLFFLGWPWMWSGTLHKLASYFLFHLHHARVPFLYFGKIIGHGYPYPWHYAWVTLAITAPTMILLLSIRGALSLPQKERRTLLAFLLYPLFVISLADVPKYDGTRLFLHSIVFIPILAGVGLAWVTRFLPRPLSLVILAAFLLIHGFQYGVYRPFFLSYYSEAVGGLRGAVALGMNPTYWGETLTRQVLAQVNETLPEKALLRPWSGYQCLYPPFQKKALLREDIRWDDENWEYELRPARFDPAGMDRDSYLNSTHLKTLAQWDHLGFPLVKLFQRRGSPR